MTEVFGTEIEYALLRMHAGQRQNPQPALVDMFAALTIAGHAVRFLRNGGRFYPDSGDHPEYCTPECTSLLDVVTHEKAGERIVDIMSVVAEAKLHASGAQGTLFLFKNNEDYSGTTYGAHENYQMARNISLSAIADAVMPFLVTRQLIAGAGALRESDRGAQYVLSQRADHMRHALGTGTTSARAVISSRDEPHADRSTHRRLHLIVGDSNMSETTTMLKVGSTSLLLRMIQEGIFFADLELAPQGQEVGKALSEVCRDLTGRTILRLDSGRTITALEVQEEYLARATEFAEDRGLAAEPDIAPVLELWERTLRAIRTGERSLIERDIDWAMKQSLLARFQDTHSLALGDPRVARLALAYHDIRPSRGMYYLLERKGLATRFSTDERIAAAISTPPATRAEVRSAFVDWARETNTRVTVDWAALTVHDPKDVDDPEADLAAFPTSSVINLPDPLISRDARVDALTRRRPTRATTAR